MFSIIKQGGMQFKAVKGKKLNVPLINAEPGSEFEIKDVLLWSGSEDQVGKPVVDGALVKAKVISHGKGDKIRVFRKERRKRFRKTRGHRQQFTTIEILGMECGSEKE